MWGLWCEAVQLDKFIRIHLIHSPPPEPGERAPFFLAIHKAFLRKNGFIRQKIPCCWSYLRFPDRPFILLWKMGPGYDKIILSIQALSTAERGLTMSAKRKGKKGRVLRTGESQCRNGNQGPAISDGTLGYRCDIEYLYPCFLCARGVRHAEDITVPAEWKGTKAWLRLHQIYTNWP